MIWSKFEPNLEDQNPDLPLKKEEYLDPDARLPFQTHP
jgi:hypothetical protein